MATLTVNSNISPNEIIFNPEDSRVQAAADLLIRALLELLEKQEAEQPEAESENDAA